MSDTLRLIVHIGVGKTGTTSIQAMLQEGQAALNRAGYWYLGMMLENAPAARYPWQKPTTVNPDFHHLPPAQATAEAVDILGQCLETARERGLHTLIWSNESFSDRGHSERIAETLRRLREQHGVAIEVVVYVRRHDAWMRSAYKQWGIKHKTYKGNVLGFRQWATGRLPDFSTPINHYTRIPGVRMNVRNYEALDDVTEDFKAAVGFPPALAAALVVKGRRNNSPEDLELYLRAICNDRVPGTVLPNYFDQLVMKGIGDWRTPTQHLAHLLPGPGDLEWVQQQSTADAESVNRLLAANGQPTLREMQPQSQPPRIDPDVMLGALAKIVVIQSMRLRNLEKRIEDLEGKGE